MQKNCQNQILVVPVVAVIVVVMVVVVMAVLVVEVILVDVVEYVDMPPSSQTIYLNSLPPTSTKE